jgi:hypothetical protein
MAVISWRDETTGSMVRVRGDLAHSEEERVNGTDYAVLYKLDGGLFLSGIRRKGEDDYMTEVCVHTKRPGLRLDRFVGGTPLAESDADLPWV